MKFFRNLFIPLGAFALGVVLSAPIFAAGTAMEASATVRPRAIVPALPRIPEGRFEVRAFGAMGDGVAVETAGVQKAIDAARSAGGGTVVVPAGVWLCGPIKLADRVALRIETGATLLMLPLDRYPGGTEHPDDLIGGRDLHDVTITGGGTIDGQGEPWWPFAKKAGARRPRMIALSACERVLIEGVTLKNSPMFHIAIGGKSSDVTVRGVTIRAPASTDPTTPSHNTDACDVSGHTVLVENCDVSVGDDNFTCGGGTSDVLITHCTYGEGHGVSIGSYTNGGVSNITVVDCTFTHTDCGIRIKSDRDRGGVVQNMWYENLRMTDVGFPILIYGTYLAKEPEFRNLTKLTPEIAARYPSQPVAARTPIFRNFTFRNITATAAAGKRAGLIWGLPEAAVSNVVLQNVHITADLPFGFYNVKGVRLVDSAITTPEGVNKFAMANAEVVGADGR